MSVAADPIVALDAAYGDAAQAIAAASFADWSSPAILQLWSRRIDAPPAPYRPGRFYERELPLLVAALEDLTYAPSAIVIDGYVTLDAAGRPGLGAHLFEALGRRTPVVGVAKTPFRSADFAHPVRRGGAKNPLYVSAIGLDAELAARHVGAMAGQHRLPEHIKRVDKEARRALASP
ncbi:MAG: endonuclease V [Neomegalonema sp.]|nr:endonuclease V [Neomegalonema sp.]